MDLRHPHRLGGILAVVDAEPRPEVDGVLLNFLSDEEHQLFALQQGPQAPALQIGAELSPVGIVQIDMVFMPDTRAVPDVVV